MKTTPQQRDVLRRLLGVATPRPWRENIMLTAEAQPLTAIVSGRPNPDDLRVVGSTLREPDGLLAIASANALADLLDDLDQATQARDANARHLAAESARVGELVCQVLQLQRTLDEVVVVCDQTIDERNESRTAMLLAVKRADAVTAERDALTAKLDRVRALHYAADNDAARTPVCEHCQGRAGVHSCGCWADSDRQPVCGHCYGDGRFERVSWPCPTLAILDLDGGE